MELSALGIIADMRQIREVKETDFDRIREIVSAALRECVTDCYEHHKFLASSKKFVGSSRLR